LKAPGTKRLKLICDDPLSKFAFKCNLRRYMKGVVAEQKVAVEAAAVEATAVRPP